MYILISSQPLEGSASLDGTSDDPRTCQLPALELRGVNAILLKVGSPVVKPILGLVGWLVEKQL